MRVHIFCMFLYVYIKLMITKTIDLEREKEKKKTPEVDEIILHIENRITSTSKELKGLCKRANQIRFSLIYTECVRTHIHAHNTILHLLC